MLPQLREVEARFEDEVIVIGVHSAKYTAEGDDRHLQAAVQRLELDHPVVNDRDLRIWQDYAVRAWPTLMFISPEGKVIGKHEGEFPYEAMVQVLEQMVEEYDAEGSISREPVPALAEPAAPNSLLAFPAGIQVDAEQDCLYVADTNHNRIIAARLDGRITGTIGSGQAGFVDGPAERARFHHPHGLFLDGNLLYVADTGNHAVRRVDLGEQHVLTLAGTGKQALSYGSGGPALETELSSPWDVAVLDGILYIAMAGNHQLWQHRLGSDEVRRFAGTGHEGKRDDATGRAWLAQPSGIDVLDGRLVFSDAETSSVRTVDPAGADDGMVETLTGKDLFDWGDVDGGPTDALLQHVTGVAFDPDRNLVFVTDTYNNKIKAIQMSTGRVETVAGSGQPEHADGPAARADFFEPHALDVGGGMLYIADTNNHAVRRFDPETGEVTTVGIREG